MTFIMSILGIGKAILQWVAIVVQWILDTIRRHPWQCGCIALVCFSAWLWRGWDGEIARHGRTKAEYAAFQTAIIDKTAVALAAQKADTLRIETEYKDKAHESDVRHGAALADARRSVDEYIRTHRMRAGTSGSSPSGTSPSPESGDPGISASLPADAVMVPEQDVRACDDAVTYALDAREWALGL